MHLGIDENDNNIYEGSGFYGAALIPKPLVSPASFISLIDNPAEHAPSGRLNECKFVFREDTYDPVTRIRRGRFYSAIFSQNWFSRLSSQGEHGGTARPPLSIGNFLTFTSTSVWAQFLRKQSASPLVVLGSKDRFTLWRILNIETNVSGEEIVVLRGRHAFGALPDIDMDKIPADRREKVSDCLNKLQEDVFRASPASVIDRARDAAAAILRAYLGNAPNLKVDADLGELLRKISEAGGLQNVFNAGDIVRILHSRAKPSVQEKIPDIRQAHEQDAEFAVQCIGSILCDLGWAEWS